MKKRDLITMFLCVPGAGLFALGMCMCLLPEWGAAVQGVWTGAAGIAVLLWAWVLHRIMSGKPAVRHFSGRSLIRGLIGMAGTHDHALGHAGAGRRGWLCRNRSASVSDSAVPRHKGVSGGGTGGRPPFIRLIVKKKRGKKMHIRKKDLFMGLIGLSMMLGSTFSPAQLSELVDELRTMR